ncbi:hypothetical protein [Glutamicibacter sp. BW78]|uniref:hypothetical protein n=1 Tax=Glutamicibacter sp. BW78 TaxID=2024403 RepID=UPI00130416CF|nr:hypothetical protein [Glutamicibacter sp. BW78]
MTKHKWAITVAGSAITSVANVAAQASTGDSMGKETYSLSSSVQLGQAALPVRLAPGT